MYFFCFCGYEQSIEHVALSSNTKKAQTTFFRFQLEIALSHTESNGLDTVYDITNTITVSALLNKCVRMDFFRELSISIIRYGRQ